MPLPHSPRRSTDCRMTRQRSIPSPASAGAILTIDLGAIRENYRILKRRLGGVPAAGVVKADGYGLGAAEVAAALGAEGCTHLLRRASRRSGRAARSAWQRAGDPGAERHTARRRRRVRGGRRGSGAQQHRADRGLAQGGQTRRPAARRDAAGRQRHVAARPAAGRCRAACGDAARPRRDRGRAGDEPSRLRRRAGASRRTRRSSPRSRRCAGSCRQRRPRSPIRRASSSAGISFRPRPAGCGALRHQPDAGKGQPDAAGGRACRPRSSRRATCRPVPASATATPIARAAPMRTATISLGYADGWPRRAAASAWHEGVRAALRRPRVDGQHHPRHLGAAARQRAGRRSGRADRPASDRRRPRRPWPARSATRS